MNTKLTNKFKREFENMVEKQNKRMEKVNEAKRKLFDQYIEFSKEVDRVIIVNKHGTLTKDNILTNGLYSHRGVSIIVEDDALSGFRIVNDRRVNLFKININEDMDGLQLYRIVGDMINNLFKEKDQ